MCRLNDDVVELETTADMAQVRALKDAVIGVGLSSGNSGGQEHFSAILSQSYQLMGLVFHRDVLLRSKVSVCI